MPETPTAIVTGASSGIGAAIVRALAAAGWTVHAAARRADRLAALAAETGCVPHALDVTEPAAMAALAALPADLLVNNAGIGAGIDGLLAAPEAEVARTLATNVTALVLLTRACLPGMAARGRGHVVNMGSVAALYPNVSALYGASKAAVHMFGQNLRIELRGTGIRVTTIAPGRVSTEFYDAAIADPAARARMKETGIRELTPADVAAAVLWAVQAPAHVNVSLIEVQPVEQTFGGARFDPVAP